MTSAEGSAAHDRTLTEVAPEAMLWGTSSNVNRILASGTLAPNRVMLIGSLIGKRRFRAPPPKSRILDHYRQAGRLRLLLKMCCVQFSLFFSTTFAGGPHSGITQHLCETHGGPSARRGPPYGGPPRGFNIKTDGFYTFAKHMEARRGPSRPAVWRASARIHCKNNWFLHVCETHGGPSRPVEARCMEGLREDSL
jgi:hypothetical protein